jgi:hypothetical protein
MMEEEEPLLLVNIPGSLCTARGHRSIHSANALADTEGPLTLGAWYQLSCHRLKSPTTRRGRVGCEAATAEMDAVTWST